MVIPRVTISNVICNAQKVSDNMRAIILPRVSDIH
nr:MAG TPA: hypothetical protein [Caudoviricetes sp.]